jgi:hypothetical protein
VVIAVVTVNMVYVTAFKQLADKGLGNKTMHKKRFAGYITGRSVSQTNFLIRQSPAAGFVFFG